MFGRLLGYPVVYHVSDPERPTCLDNYTPLKQYQCTLGAQELYTFTVPVCLLQGTQEVTDNVQCWIDRLPQESTLTVKDVSFAVATF